MSEWKEGCRYPTRDGRVARITSHIGGALYGVVNGALYRWRADTGTTLYVPGAAPDDADSMDLMPGALEAE